uniref:Uncharacterized protein n=1 Tax=Heterorhabditis bacteriophora TaxID=37862 RepID=A0A1I7WFK0_HETBA
MDSYVLLTIPMHPLDNRIKEIIKKIIQNSQIYENSWTLCKLTHLILNIENGMIFLMF